MGGGALSHLRLLFCNIVYFGSLSKVNEKKTITVFFTLLPMANAEMGPHEDRYKKMMKESLIIPHTFTNFANFSYLKMYKLCMSNIIIEMLEFRYKYQY